MIDLGTPQSRNQKSLRARTTSSSDEEDSATSMSQGRDKSIDAPRTKLIITSYSRSPDGSTAGSGTFGHSMDSGARKRTTKIVESSLDSIDSVTFLEDAGVPEDNDDMTIDSTMKAIEESVEFSRNKVTKKYQDKPLPGFIKLREDGDRPVENFEPSLTTPAIVHSSHTMSGKMSLRRGQTGSLYHEGLPMTERARATSPVSGPMERLRIRGFKEPPRDYVQHHKLTPIDHQQELKRYGYGKSPTAKSEALAGVIEKRYSDRNIKQLQVVESPLNKFNMDKTVKVPLYPGGAKSQHAEALEREAAERARSREAKHKHKHKHKKLKRGGSPRSVMTPQVMPASMSADGSVSMGDSLGESVEPVVMAGGTVRMTDDGEEGVSGQEEDEENSVLSDHENFDLDAHLNNAFEAMEEEALTNNPEPGNNNNTGGIDKFDLHSSTGYLDSGAEIAAEVSRDIGSAKGSPQGGPGESIATGTTATASTTSARAREVLGDHVHGQIMAVRVARDSKEAEHGVEGGPGLAGLGSLTTGFALSQGSGLRLQEQSSTLKVKVKPTPAQRRRTKMAQEKKALKEQGAQRNIVIAAHGRNLDYFKLKNPQKTSASGRDPRPGALPHFPSPYYEPKTYRLPESLEDRLNNINQEDEDKQLDHLISQESSSELLMSQLPAQTDRDPHSWRRPFLGGKKIRFDDAQDTDEENENGLDSQADDFEFSLGDSSVGGESEGSLVEEAEGEDEAPAPASGGDGPPPASGQASGSDRGRSVQGSRPLTSSQSEARSKEGDAEGEGDVGQDSLLTTSQVDDTSLVGSIALQGGGGGALPPDASEQPPTQSEFLPITASADQEGYFPGADPNATGAGDSPDGHHTLGTKSKDPFFHQEGSSPGDGGGSIDGNGRVSPSGSVSRGLSASISLVRASIDDTKAVAIAPPNALDVATVGGALSTSSSANAGAIATGVSPGGAGQGLPSPLMMAPGQHATQGAGALGGPPAPMGVIGIRGASGVIPGGAMDESLLGTMSQVEGGVAMEALFHPSSLTGAAANTDGDDQSVNSSTHSITSSMNAREAMRKRAEEEELKKKRQKERAVAKLRAQQLAKLQEEQSKKTMTFIQNHADPDTARRTDYKFPEHGIQKPGVGEARVRHRDYAYDSMYLHHDGSMRSQKDEGNSSLLETVHLDVRLKSPAVGTRPITPLEREALQQEHMFKYTYTGSMPPTPDQSHRKIAHQIQILEDDLRAMAQLQPDPVVRYDPTAVEQVVVDPNDMSRSDYMPASQRFREEAEVARQRRETEALAAAEERVRKAEEAEEAALAAAGIKKPKRKKLQKPKKKAAAEPIPIAYSVGAGPKGGSGVGASIVPRRVPSRIRKPKLRFSKEQKAEETLSGETLAMEPRFPVGNGLGMADTNLPDIFTPVKKAETEIKISGGVVIFTKDNRAIDPEGYARMEWMKSQRDVNEHKHNIWGQDFDTAAAQRTLLESNLDKAMIIEKRASTSSADGGSRGSRRGTILGLNSSPPGSQEGSIARMPSPGKELGQESTLSLHSFMESPDKLQEGEEEDEA